MPGGRSSHWRTRLGQRLRAHLPPVLLVLAFLVTWEAAVDIWRMPKWLLPSPAQIGLALAGSAWLLAGHTWQTAIEAAAGFAAATVSGIILAVLIDLSPVLRRALYPLLVASQNIPIIAIAPLLMVWFGYGLAPKVIVVALVCFFPIVVSTVDGLAAADRDMIDLLLVMGASRWQTFLKARVPAALPSLFSGLKIAATYSVMGAVIGEWLGASRGIGVFMTRSSHSFLTDRLFAAILVIAVLSILLFGAIELTGRLVMPWHYAAARAAREESWPGLNGNGNGTS